MDWILRWWTADEIRAVCQELGVDEKGLVVLADRYWQGGTLADLVAAALEQ